MQQKRQKGETMDSEQRENLARLERVADELRRVLDLFNLAGYKASAEEVAEIDKIAQKAAAAQKWARM